MKGFALMNVEKKGTCVQLTDQIQVLINLRVTHDTEDKGK